MTRLDAVLAKLARRAARSVSLEEALFSQRGFAYAWYRARFLFLRIPFGMALHAAEIVAFSALYELDLIGPMLAIRSLPAVASALWWGALEALRERVRAAKERGEWGRAELAVRSFLALSVDVGVAGALLAVAYVELYPSSLGEGFDIFDAYALACSVRFLLETLARTYHAGIFATRRVYRPVWSLLSPDVLELGVALALWSSLGPWGFSLATLFGGALGAALTIHYSRRAYEEQGTFRPRFARLGRARRVLQRRDYGALLTHALANLSGHIDAFAVLILSRSLSGGLPFVVLLHAGRPLFSAVSGYARLFYFDFQRLELGQSPLLTRRFTRIVKRFAVLIAAIAIALAALLHWLLFRGQYWLDLALLAGYVLARSLLAIEQLLAFTARRYRELAQGTAVIVLSALGARLGLRDERGQVAALVAALALAAIWFYLQNRRRPEPRAEAGGVLGVLRWLDLLQRERAPLDVGYALIDARAGARASAVLQAVTGVLGERARVSRVGRRGIVWFLPSEPADDTLRRRLLAASAGCLEVLRLSGPYDAAAACRAVLALEPFGESRASCEGERLGAQALREAFRREFHGGAVLDVRGAPPPSILPDRAQRGFVARSIIAASLGRPAPERQPQFPRVAVYCPRGEAELVFIAPSSAEPHAFRRFARLAEQSSLAATVGK